MQKKQGNNNLTSWEDHLDKKYGKPGTPSEQIGSVTIFILSEFF